MSGDPRSRPNEPDSSFLAAPDEVLDWRRVVLTSTAIRAGVLDHLPGTAADIAARTDLDAHSLRVLLDGLAIWGVVERSDAMYMAGPNFPGPQDRSLLHQHGLFMQRWSTQLDDRLTDRLIADHPPRPPGALDSWLAALGANAQKRGPEIITKCLDHFPDTSSVLDVAGGHGEYGIEAARRGCDVVLLDVPSVIDVVSEWPAVEASGIELQAADIYDASTDRQFDLVLCFGFTHTQPVDQLTPLFAKLADLTAPGGGVAVHTFVRDAGPVPTLFAVQMLLTGRGGDSHRIEDYTEAMINAGFDPPTVDDMGDRSLLLAHKR